MIAATIVHVRTLLELVVTALVAGVGVTSVFGIAMFGTTRSVDLRRSGRTRAALAHALLSGAALLVFAAAIVYGVTVLTKKS